MLWNMLYACFLSYQELNGRIDTTLIYSMLNMKLQPAADQLGIDGRLIRRLLESVFLNESMSFKSSPIQHDVHCVSNASLQSKIEDNVGYALEHGYQVTTTPFSQVLHHIQSGRSIATHILPSFTVSSKCGDFWLPKKMVTARMPNSRLRNPSTQTTE